MERTYPHVDRPVQLEDALRDDETVHVGVPLRRDSLEGAFNWFEVLRAFADKQSAAKHDHLPSSRNHESVGDSRRANSGTLRSESDQENSDVMQAL